MECFTSVGKKVKIAAGGKSNEVTAQRDILGLLSAKSQQHDIAINTDKESIMLPTFFFSTGHGHVR